MHAIQMLHISHMLLESGFCKTLYTTAIYIYIYITLYPLDRYSYSSFLRVLMWLIVGHFSTKVFLLQNNTSKCVGFDVVYLEHFSRTYTHISYSVEHIYSIICMCNQWRAPSLHTYTSSTRTCIYSGFGGYRSFPIPIYTYICLLSWLDTWTQYADRFNS